MLNRIGITKEFGISIRTLARWRNLGCPYVKVAVGGLKVRTLYDPAAVRAWLEARVSEKLNTGKDGTGMNAGQLKERLADVGDDLAVLVKTAHGWQRVSLAYEEILWEEKTVPGDELEAFCIELCPVECSTLNSEHRKERK